METKSWVHMNRAERIAHCRGKITRLKQRETAAEKQRNFGYASIIRDKRYQWERTLARMTK